MRITDNGNSLFVDIRQTDKGKPTTTGVFLQAPEFIWLKKAIQTRDQVKATLEYGQRKLNVCLEENGLLIEITKARGDINEIELSSEETKRLKSELGHLEQELSLWSRKAKIPIDFNDELYFNEYMSNK